MERSAESLGVPAPPVHPAKEGQFPFGRVLKSKASEVVYHTDYENKPDERTDGYVNVAASLGSDPAGMFQLSHRRLALNSVNLFVVLVGEPRLADSSLPGDSGSRSSGSATTTRSLSIKSGDSRYDEAAAQRGAGVNSPAASALGLGEEAQFRAQIASLTPNQLRTILEALCRASEANTRAISDYAEVCGKLKVKFDKKDWNGDFQKLLGQPDSETKFRKLYHLAHDFVYAAGTYAKIIISELLLPATEKTIQPAELGGVAGGTKFIVQNILFKFVLDFELKPGLWMYGGDQRSDENGMEIGSAVSLLITFLQQ